MKRWGAVKTAGYSTTTIAPTEKAGLLIIDVQMMSLSEAYDRRW